MEMNIEGTVGEAIETYTGRELERLECAPDPNVAGCYGLRAWFEDGEVADFVVKGVALRSVTEDDLEEVEFTTWPPTSLS